MAEGRDRGLTRFFGNFANAILERTLPRIREFLLARLGPNATLSKLEVDGPRVRMIGATIPLGARLALVIDEATFLTQPEGLAIGHAPVRLESLRGWLRASEDDGTVFDAPIELVGRKHVSDAWVDADLTLRNGTWKTERGIGQRAPLEGTARVRITRDSWSVERAALISGESKIALDASGVTYDGERGLRAHLVAEHARVGHFVDALVAWTGRDAIGHLPMVWDGLLDGTIDTADGRANVDLSIRTEHSSLTLVFNGAIDGAIETARVEGTIGFVDLGTDALIDAAGSLPLEVLAEASGRSTHPSIRIALASARVRAWTFLEPGAWRLDATREAGAWTASIKLAEAIVANLANRPAIDARSRTTPSESALALSGEGVVHVNALRHLGTFAEGEPMKLTLEVTGTTSVPSLRVSARSEAVAWRGLRLRRLRAEGVLSSTVRSLRASARSLAGGLSIKVSRDRVRLGAHRLDAGGTVAILAALSERPLLVLAADEPFDARSAETLFSWPRDAEAWADVTVHAKRLRGALHVQTPRSSASIEPFCLDLESRALEGSRARGVAGMEDLLILGLFRRAPLRPLPGGRCEANGWLRGTLDEPRVSLDLVAKTTRWQLETFPSPVELSDARGHLEVDRTSIAITAFEGRALGGELEADLAHHFGDRQPRVERASARGLDARVLEWLGLPAIADVTVAADAFTLHDKLHAQIIASSRQSEIGLSLPSGALRGRVVLSDFVPLGGVDLGGTVRVDGVLEGLFEDAPRLELGLGGDGITIRFGDTEFRLVRAATRLRATRTHVEWHDAEAELLGGRVRARGVYGFSPGFSGLATTLDAEAIAVEEIAALAPYLAGRLALKGFLFGALAAPRLTAGIRVEEPRYIGLDRLRARFSRWGLKPLSPRGVGPLRLRVRVERGAALIELVEAALDGARAEGHVRRAADGSLDGVLEVLVARRWLETSHLLTYPARLLGDVSFPVHVEGANVPRLRADALAAIDRWLEKTHLGELLRGAFDSVTAPETRDEDAVVELDSDALFERVAAGGEDATDAVGHLLARGLSPQEIARRCLARTR